MSWDIFVHDFPDGAQTPKDIPSDFKPAAIGLRSDLIAKIQTLVPTANFSDPSWGLIDGGDWAIEVNIGEVEKCNGFALHVRGGELAVPVIAAILDHLNLRGIDAQAGEFFQAGPEALESFRMWRD